MRTVVSYFEGRFTFTSRGQAAAWLRRYRKRHPEMQAWRVPQGEGDAPAVQVRSQKEIEDANKS